MHAEGTVGAGLASAAAAGLMLLLAACAGTPSVAPERATAPVAVINTPPSSRGNPPFYEVLGKRYHVLATSEGYRERGIASWYGTDFHGLSTAGGEPYDMYALTAAHKTLPIPTWVEVTNLGNGKRVIVKINDRGPFVADRIIDLSYTAAKELDMIGSGTARVEVRALGVSGAAPIGTPPATLQARSAAPLRKPASASATPSNGSFALIRSADAATIGPDDVPLRRLYVQVGAFADRGNAVRLIEQLKRDGYANVSIWSDGKRSRVLHRVRIGPLAAVADYDSVRERLRALGIEQTQLVVGQ